MRWLLDTEERKLRSLFSKKLQSKGFTDEDVLDIFVVLDSVCPDCLDGEIGCPCARDE